jgi:hypothetical protein
MTTKLNSAYESGHVGLSRHDGDNAIELVTEWIMPSQFDDVRRNRDGDLTVLVHHHLPGIRARPRLPAGGSQALEQHSWDEW